VTVVRCGSKINGWVIGCLIKGEESIKKIKSEKKISLLSKHIYYSKYFKNIYLSHTWKILRKYLVIWITHYRCLNKLTKYRCIINKNRNYKSIQNITKRNQLFYLFKDNFSISWSFYERYWVITSSILIYRTQIKSDAWCDKNTTRRGVELGFWKLLSFLWKWKGFLL